MQSSIKTDGFLDNLERLARVRQAISYHLDNISQTIEQAEKEGEEGSGKLALNHAVEDISIASKNLRQGVFRILVLGDLKRGKSTFINALIGENLLPSDVNPCTAILTVLRYGKEKTVTVYFKDEKLPERLDFPEFKNKYTIDPDEAKRLEKENCQAFPDVEYAIVEYPLSLLEKGIEIVDTPGLNDTETRNQLSLSYINNCHAILFIFRAIQPCTLEEKRYLENYLKGRGLSIFFLINAWDEIQKELIDVDDEEELKKAEEKIRQVFWNYLGEYCQINGENFYDRRVFEVSSLNALRQRLNNANTSLEGTGFSEFLTVFNQFLTEERIIVQFQQAQLLAHKGYYYLHESIERRISLLAEDGESLKQRIDSVEPEFKQLQDIRDRFINEIEITRDHKAKEIANSLQDYILNLGNTFEADFVRYQPSLGFLDFLFQDKRDEFNRAFQQAFERYINEQLSTWERSAQEKLEEAFYQLAKSADNYGNTYRQITDSINEKLIGQIHNSSQSEDDKSPAWASWAMGFFSLATGNVAGVFMASAGFDWKNIFVNWIAVIGIGTFLRIFAGSLLVPLGIWAIPVLGIGVAVFQAEQTRKDFIQQIQKELVKYLPKIAQEQAKIVEQAVKDCLTTYEQEVSKRINDDIKSRQAELDNLLKQKESREINQEKEVKRLQELDKNVLTEKRHIDELYDELLFDKA